MPKETFHNLHEAKKQKIIEAAISEFETYHYDQASVNRIVENSGISKGSFYQYFDDKKDIYLYILNIIVTKKMTYITPALQNPFDHPFFEVVRDMNRCGLQFAKEHPRFMRIGNRFLQDKTHPIFLEVMAGNEKIATDVYEQLLKRAIEKGDIRKDIDVPFTAHMLFSLSSQMVTFNANMTQDVWLDNMMASLDKLLDLMANGLKPQDKEDHNDTR